MGRARAAIRIITAITLGLISVLLWLAYYFQYYVWRDCFNELGRCYDETSGVVYLEQSGIIWMSLALIASFLSVVFLVKGKRRSGS